MIAVVRRHDADAELAEPFASRETAERRRLPLEELLLPIAADDREERHAA